MQNSATSNPIVIPLTILSKDEAEHIIKDILETANGPAPQGNFFMEALPTLLADRLRSWIKAGCDLLEWQEQNRGAVMGVNEAFSHWHPVFFKSRRGGMRPALVGPDPLTPVEELMPGADGKLADMLFAAFLIAGGPRGPIALCDRCRNFYWNRWGHANKRFCSRKCSQLQTAAEGQQERLRDERGKKNAKIKQAINALIWDKPRTQDWKEWVSTRTGVTKSYLTRAFNQELLGTPNGLNLTKRQLDYLKSKTKGA